MGATHPIAIFYHFSACHQRPRVRSSSQMPHMAGVRGGGWSLHRLSSLTSWRQLGQLMLFQRDTPKTKGTTKSQNKLKLSWKNETWRNSMSKFKISTNSFRNLSPFDLWGFRCQETWPCFFWHLTMWFMGSGCQTFHLELKLMSTSERLTTCFFEIEAYYGSSQFFPVQFQVPGPLLSN